MIQGFATIVVAERIGADCLISQQVTIGWSDRGGPPVLGDRVRVGAGALILGSLTVGGVPARVPQTEDRFSARRRSPERA